MEIRFRNLVSDFYSILIHFPFGTFLISPKESSHSRDLFWIISISILVCLIFLSMRRYRAILFLLFEIRFSLWVTVFYVLMVFLFLSMLKNIFFLIYLLNTIFSKVTVSWPTYNGLLITLLLYVTFYFFICTFFPFHIHINFFIFHRSRKIVSYNVTVYLEIWKKS